MGIELTPEEQNTLIDSWGNSPLSLKEIVGKVAEAQLKKLQDLAPEKVVEEIAKKIKAFYNEQQKSTVWFHESLFILAREIAIFKVVERERKEPKAYHCPQCGNELRKVIQSYPQMLNSEQFDSVKAGDWYCSQCKSDRARTGYKYYWESELADELTGGKDDRKS